MKKVLIVLLFSVIVMGGIGYFVYPYVMELIQKEEKVAPAPEKKPEVKEEDLTARLEEIKNKEKLSADDVYLLLKASNLIDETNNYEDDTEDYPDYKAIKQVIDVGSYMIFDFEGKKGDFKSIEGDRSEEFLESIEEMKKVKEDDRDTVLKENILIAVTGNNRQTTNVRKMLEKQVPLTEEELYESKEQKEMIASFKNDDFLTFAKKYFEYEQFAKEDLETLWRLTSLLDSRGKEIKGYVVEAGESSLLLYLKENWEDIDPDGYSGENIEDSFLVHVDFENKLVKNAIKPGDELNLYAKFEHEGSQNKELILEWDVKEAEVLTLNGKKVKKEKIEQPPEDLSIDVKDQKRIKEFAENVQNKKKDQLVILKPHEEKDIEITLTYTNKIYYKSNIGTFETPYINEGPMDGPIYPTKTRVCEEISVESSPGYRDDEIPYEYIDLDKCSGYTSSWGFSFVSGDKIK